MNTGIHTIPEADYHADPCDTPSLSSSIVNLIIQRSPLHAYHAHPRLNPDYQADESDEKFDVGTAAHRLLLEGDSAGVEVIPFDDWRKAEAKILRDVARADGRIPLLSHQWADVEAMVASAHAQLAAYRLEPAPFTEGKPEQTLVWEENGVLCRARPDWLTFDGRYVWDYKTAHDAFPERWGKRALFNNGYDVQAALYRRAVKALLGTGPRWRWIVQEKKPPYALAVVEPGADVLATADIKIDWALRRWQECLTSGVWPGYGTDVYRADVPTWAEDARWLEELEAA